MLSIKWVARLCPGLRAVAQSTGWTEAPTPRLLQAPAAILTCLPCWHSGVLSVMCQATMPTSFRPGPRCTRVSSSLLLVKESSPGKSRETHRHTVCGGNFIDLQLAVCLGMD